MNDRDRCYMNFSPGPKMDSEWMKRERCYMNFSPEPKMDSGWMKRERCYMNFSPEPKMDSGWMKRERCYMNFSPEPLISLSMLATHRQPWSNSSASPTDVDHHSRVLNSDIVVHDIHWTLIVNLSANRSNNIRDEHNIQYFIFMLRLSFFLMAF